MPFSLIADNRNNSLKVLAQKKCAGCHGIDGNSQLDYHPNIAGLSKSYILKQLNDFKRGIRINSEMEAVVNSLSISEITLLSKYYSNQTLLTDKLTSSAKKSKLIDLNLGKAIFRGERFDYGIPACASCHGDRGEGGKSIKHGLIYPKLIGQKEQYSINQLKLFREKKRSNDSPAMMRNIAAMMDDEDIESVVAYISTLVGYKD